GERGRRIVERFLPGLPGELVRAGAELMDFTRDFAWLAPSGWYLRVPSDLPMLACTRDLIDWGVRGRVAALPNVRVRQRVDIAGLVRGTDGARVAGVRLRSRPADDYVDRGGGGRAAAPVVGAARRPPPLPPWLCGHGHEPP